MTISATTLRKSFTGDGSTTAFSFDKRFLANADLKVYQEGTLKTIATHYTVTGAGNSGGGTVTFVTAPALNDEIVIINDPSNTQSLDLVANDPFPAESLEAVLDRLTLQIQRCRDLISRSVVLSDTDLASASTALPTPVSNNLLAWNLAATALQNVAPNSLGTLTIGAGSITDALLAATLDLSGKTLTLPFLAVAQQMYPVGSLYFNASSTTDPATLLGFGTWTAVAGRVLVGYDAGQTEFDTLLETGGAKTHTLSIAEMPAHAHKLKTENIQLRSPADYNRISYTTNAVTVDAPATEETGGGQAHNNLQPYLVVAIWRRTA